jgi:hypothetical protein
MNADTLALCDVANDSLGRNRPATTRKVRHQITDATHCDLAVALIFAARGAFGTNLVGNINTTDVL